MELHGPNQRIAYFHPNFSYGTAGVRGTRILNGGRFYWEINMSERIFGTSMMFGIGKNYTFFNFDLNTFLYLNYVKFYMIITISN